MPPHEAVTLFSPSVNPPGPLLFSPENNPPSPSGYTPPGRSEPDYSDVFSPAFAPPSPSGYEPTERSDTSTTQSSLVFNEGGWLRNGETKHSYRMGETNMNWEDAGDYCRAQGGFLAEVIGSKEHFALSSLLGEQKSSLSNFWIGLRQPYFRWDQSRRLVTWGNWKVTESSGKRSCTVINGKTFKWENHDCTYNLGYRPLCQKGDEDNSEKSEKQRKDDVEDHCVVVGVTVDLNNWLERQHDIKSAGGCHNICLRNNDCHYWTWDKVNHLCYLKDADSNVRPESNFESGTTLQSKGCNRPIKQEDRESRIEICSCETPKRASSQLDPRSLPFHENGDRKSEGNNNLGRFIATSACPYGQELVCSNDTDDLILEAKKPFVPQANITDCLVYDVRLAAGKAFRTLYDVANSETCHAHCLSTRGCTYWTWRGELKSKVCFLLRQESRMFRRAGSSAGTVLPKYGCNSKLTVPDLPIAITSEEKKRGGDVCVCEREDDGWTSLLDPRAGPKGVGRIVNRPLKEACPQGFVRICTGDDGSRDFEPLPSDALEDWDFSGYGRTAEIKKDDILAGEEDKTSVTSVEAEKDESDRSPRVLKAEAQKDDQETGGSGVNFPQ